MKPPRVPISPFSTPARLAKMDGRCWEARFLKTKRKEIIEYLKSLGINELNYEQQQILERICYFELHIKLADMKAMQTPFSDIGARTYAGFSMSINKLMAKLRTAGRDKPSAEDDAEDASLTEYISNLRAERRQA